MTYGSNVQCDLCGRTETVRTTLIYRYLVSSNHIIPASATPSWCFDCDGIRDSEHLPTAERLAELIVELENGGMDNAELIDKASFLGIEVDLQQEYTRELTHRRVTLEWRLQRRSPPRCLTCGGTNHRPLRWAAEPCEHPGCGGIFQSELDFHSSQSTYAELDAEGHRLNP